MGERYREAKGHVFGLLYGDGSRESLNIALAILDKAHQEDLENEEYLEQIYRDYGGEGG